MCVFVLIFSKKKSGRIKEGSETFIKNYIALTNQNSFIEKSVTSFSQNKIQIKTLLDECASIDSENNF
jgi:hypothetical protein